MGLMFENMHGVVRDQCRPASGEHVLAAGFTFGLYGGEPAVVVARLDAGGLAVVSVNEPDLDAARIAVDVFASDRDIKSLRMLRAEKAAFGVQVSRLAGVDEADVVSALERVKAATLAGTIEVLPVVASRLLGVTVDGQGRVEWAGNGVAVALACAVCALPRQLPIRHRIESLGDMDVREWRNGKVRW